MFRKMANDKLTQAQTLQTVEKVSPGVIPEINKAEEPEQTTAHKDEPSVETVVDISIVQEQTLVQLSNNTVVVDPREYRSNSIYGNYVIASRPIEPNEIIGIDPPISLSAYGPSYAIPYCLSCYKDISLSQRCSTCRWPICSIECESSINSTHRQNECEIFNKALVRPRGRIEEYIAIEVLRCLLLRDRNPTIWNEQVLKLEPHFNERQKSKDATDIKHFVMKFLLEKCKLKEEFSELEIDHVLGIVSVNTFSAYKFTGQNISLLFPSSVSFIQHDCNPNVIKLIRPATELIDDNGHITITDNNNYLVNIGSEEDSYELNLSETDEEEDEADQEVVQIITQGCTTTSTKDQQQLPNVVMELKSARLIASGDVLSINYVDLDLNVIERGAYLKDSFYFYCDCLKCRVELFNEIHFVTQLVA